MFPPFPCDRLPSFNLALALDAAKQRPLMEALADGFRRSGKTGS
ncbi:MAG: hypothetical protein BWX73_01192 [Lentisphaerae bacterium ADurb.Bin082]|nr:MAG: hypothetical protein BWX73_01192 [Lentisphaerae bacterium ADurb.Bin082]